MEYTTNLNLKKPDVNEFYNVVEQENANMDIIDEAVNTLNESLNEVFQSVSNGKELIASAITDKKVPTDADATFAEMAANIEGLKLGSGNATTADVLSGKTFTNDDGVEYTGELVLSGNATAANVLASKTFYNTDAKTKETGAMTDNSSTTKSGTISLDTTNKRVQLAVPANGYYNTSSKLYQTYANVASKIGLTAAKLVSGNTVLGIAGTATNMVPSSGIIYNAGSNPGGMSKDYRYYYSANDSYTCTFNTSDITLYEDNGGWGSCIGLTSNPIDLSPYTTLYMKYTFSGNGGTKLFFVGTKDNPRRYANGSNINWGLEITGLANVTLSAGTEKTASISLGNISALNKKGCFVGVFLNAGDGITQTLKIHKIWCE